MAYLRQPFVVTFALGATTVACGGSTTDGSSEGNASDQSGGQSAGGSSGASQVGAAGVAGDIGAGGAAMTTTCPSTTPIVGTPCQLVAGVECDTGRSPCGFSTTARCVDGVWVAAPSACNPPPPPTDVCPVVEPVQGEYCNVVPGLVCNFGSCYGSFSSGAECVNEQWVLYQASCNPPFFDAGASTDAGASSDGGAPSDGGASADAGADG